MISFFPVPHYRLVNSLTRHVVHGRVHDGLASFSLSDVVRRHCHVLSHWHCTLDMRTCTFFTSDFHLDSSLRSHRSTNLCSDLGLRLRSHGRYHWSLRVHSVGHHVWHHSRWVHRRHSTWVHVWMRHSMHHHRMHADSMRRQCSVG